MRTTVGFLVVAASLAGCSGLGGSNDASDSRQAGLVANPTTPPPSNPGTQGSSSDTDDASGSAGTPAEDDGPPSDRRKLRRVTRITGALTPKSVVASAKGMVVAQNMIYTHTVSVYDSDHELVTTLRDRITPSRFGYDEWERPVKGGPVEASFSPDGDHLWVSNYSMYGPGFDKPGDDVCSPDSGLDRSFLYRVDTKRWVVDGAVLVGSVPKYVEATPDGKTVLVTNWCTWDLSVVDTSTMKETARIPIGRYPRGIAVSPDSSRAYVAVMGGSHLTVVDLEAVAEGRRGAKAARRFSQPGRAPRHLNLSPDGRELYVTLNSEGTVAKVNARTGKVRDTVSTGRAPRSSVLSPDGTALFVVNYESDTVSRVRTSDMKVLESKPVDHHPIGITYNPVTDEVWVCSYVGSITVFSDAAPKR